jgi:hypothetical protein
LVDDGLDVLSENVVSIWWFVEEDKEMDVVK